MFTTLQGFEATKDDCTRSIPNPSTHTTFPKNLFCGFFKEKGQFITRPCDVSTQNENAIELLSYTRSLLYEHFTLPPITIDKDDVLVNGKKPLIEAHRYAAHTECVVPESPFIWHKDDEGGVDYNTYTAIYYLHKSEEPGKDSFKGGNLSCAFPSNFTVENKEGDGVSKTDISIRKEGVDLDVYNIITKTGRVVLMRGDVWHVPGAIERFCHGCRDSVVVQIKRD